MKQCVRNSFFITKTSNKKRSMQHVSFFVQPLYYSQKEKEKTEIEGVKEMDDLYSSLFKKLTNKKIFQFVYSLA